MIKRGKNVKQNFQNHCFITPHFFSIYNCSSSKNLRQCTIYTEDKITKIRTLRNSWQKEHKEGKRGKQFYSHSIMIKKHQIVKEQLTYYWHSFTPRRGRACEGLRDTLFL